MLGTTIGKSQNPVPSGLITVLTIESKDFLFFLHNLAW
jgi:hypothetical protein